MIMAESFVPLEILRANQNDVRIRWNDGKDDIYNARMLRLACSCAACQDEMSGKRLIKESEVTLDVKPLNIEQVGRYAIQIHWSDGHATGIYTFDYLRELGEKER